MIDTMQVVDGNEYWQARQLTTYDSRLRRPSPVSPDGRHRRRRSELFSGLGTEAPHRPAAGRWHYRRSASLRSPKSPVSISGFSFPTLGGGWSEVCKGSPGAPTLEIRPRGASSSL